VLALLSTALTTFVSVAPLNVVAASGLTFLGVGAAFWALAAGLLVRAVQPRSPAR
jgi:predicted benzoate:H+ symporter BenE